MVICTGGIPVYLAIVGIDTFGMTALPERSDASWRVVGILLKRIHTSASGRKVFGLAAGGGSHIPSVSEAHGGGCGSSDVGRRKASIMLG